MKSVALAFATLLVAAGAASAQPADPYGPPGAPPPAAAPMRPQRPEAAALRAALIARFDRNHDGRLEPRERIAAARALRKLANRLERRARRQARRDQQLGGVIERYDLNGDGNVGPGEMPPAMARRLRRLDRNGDGWVDDRDFPQ